MNNQTLINLIKELREYELVPSKKKTALLANFNEKQIDLLLKLIKSDLVEQYNLNYAIEQISKIKELTFIDQSILEKLYLRCYIGDEERVLKFILNELKIDLNIGILNIKKLSDLGIKYQNISRIPSIFDILENKKLRDLKLTGVVLDFYDDMYSETEREERIGKINQVISNEDILKFFKKEKNNTDRQNAYRSMLKSFIKIMPDDEKFDQVYSNFSDLARNDEIKDFTMIADLIHAASNIDTNFGFFYTILSTIKDWKKVRFLRIVSILNNFEQTAKGDNNLAWLTIVIYEKVPSICVDDFYNKLLGIINDSKIDENLSMEDINHFIIKLLNNKKFLGYIAYNKEYSLDFIKCAFTTKKSHLGEYLMIGTNETLSFESYSNLLSSFRTDLNSKHFEEKVSVYSNQQVLNIIDKDSKILRRLNYIMDNYSCFTDGELSLFKNPKFLKSNFFKDKYYNFISKGDFIGKDAAYLNNFFAILGTFDFDDPNLLFYMTTLLAQTKDANDLDKIYSERLSNQETGALSDIQTSLYEVLASKDNDQVEEYINMLASAPSNFDVKADTPIIYQKQMKRK